MYVYRMHIYCLLSGVSVLVFFHSNPLLCSSRSKPTPPPPCTNATLSSVCVVPTAPHRLTLSCSNNNTPSNNNRRRKCVLFLTMYFVPFQNVLLKICCWTCWNFSFVHFCLCFCVCTDFHVRESFAYELHPTIRTPFADFTQYISFSILALLFTNVL